MSTGLINIIKRAAIEAVENGKPCDVRYGTVTSIKPLKIQVTPNFILPESLLTVPQHLTDYKVTVSFDWDTEDTDGHTHEVSSNKTKTITIVITINIFLHNLCCTRLLGTVELAY